MRVVHLIMEYLINKKISSSKPLKKLGSFVFILILPVTIFFIPLVSWADIISFTGGETGGLLEVATAGTVSNQSSIVKNGSYSFRTNPTTTGTGSFQVARYLGDGSLSTTGDLGSASMYVSFWFRADTLPSSNFETILHTYDTGNNNKYRVSIGSDGKLIMANRSLVNLGTTTTALSTGTWYHINIYTEGSTTGNYEIKINGVSELTGTGDFRTSNFRIFRFGKASNIHGNSVDFYYDDTILDNSTYHSSDVKVIGLMPNANGTYSEWTGGTNSSDWQEVDEIPNDNATTYVRITTDNKWVSFNMEDTSTKGISGTIHSVLTHRIMRSGTTVPEFQALTISGSTQATTTSRTISNAFIGFFQLFNTNPNTSSAWTTTGVDALQVGAICVLAGGSFCDMTQASVQVLFTPGSALSGTAYESAGGGTLNNKTIRVYKNGATNLGSATTHASNGTFSMTTSEVLNSGDIVTLFVDGDSVKANTVFVSDGLDKTGLNIYGGALIVRHETGSNITNANLHTGAIYGESDMVYATSTSNAVTLNSNIDLYVWTGDTYAPGATLTTQGTGGVYIESGATLTASNSHNLTIAGNFANNGTFTHNNGEVILNTTKTSAITSISNMSFYDLTVTTAGKTIQFEVHSENVPTFSFDGQFTVTGQNGLPVYIQSTVPTAQWLVDFNVAQTGISNAYIRDSGCALGSLSVVFNVTNFGGGNNGNCWNLANRGSDGSNTISSVEQGSGNGVLMTGGVRSSGSLPTEGGSGGGEEQGGGGSGGGGGASP